MYSAYKTTQLDEQAALGILTHLNKQELQKLLDSDESLLELIADNQQVKQIEQDKTSLLAGNRSVAQYNLSQEPRLNTAKQQLAATYEQAIQVQKDYDDKKQKLDCNTTTQSADTLLALLQAESAKTEEQTEDMAQRLLDGDFEIESFIDQYVIQRTQAHERKIKVEKMQELIRTGTTSSAPPPIPSKPSHMGAAPYPTSQGWGAPYPAGGGMAMPNPLSYLPR